VILSVIGPVIGPALGQSPHHKIGHAVAQSLDVEILLHIDEVKETAIEHADQKSGFGFRILERNMPFAFVFFQAFADRLDELGIDTIVYRFDLTITAGALPKKDPGGLVMGAVKLDQLPIESEYVPPDFRIGNTGEQLLGIFESGRKKVNEFQAYGEKYVFLGFEMLDLDFVDQAHQVQFIEIRQPMPSSARCLDANGVEMPIFGRKDAVRYAGNSIFLPVTICSAFLRRA
jgi:hypothetical protein